MKKIIKSFKTYEKMGKKRKINLMGFTSDGELIAKPTCLDYYINLKKKISLIVVRKTKKFKLKNILEKSRKGL